MSCSLFVASRSDDDGASDFPPFAIAATAAAAGINLSESKGRACTGSVLLILLPVKSW